MGHHARVARQTDVDAELVHALQYLLLQRLALIVPSVRVRTAPPFHIVHQPPSLKRRTGYNLVYFGTRVAQLQQHVSPNDIGTHDVEAEIYAVQRHPVELLLPALPVPERHRIRKCAVVEVVAVLYVGLAALLFLPRRQHLRQTGMHRVPRELNAEALLQILMHTVGYVHVAVTSHRHLAVAVAYLVELAVGRHKLCAELARSAFVDALKQRVDGVCGGVQCGETEKE